MKFSAHGLQLVPPAPKYPAGQGAVVVVVVVTGVVVVVVLAPALWHTFPFPCTTLQVKPLQHLVLAHALPALEHLRLMHMVRLLLEILPPVHFLQRRRPFACVMELMGQRLHLLPATA